MDPITLLGVVGYLLLVIGWLITRIDTACVNPECVAAHSRHRDAEQRAERERRREADAWAAHIWHVKPNPDCDLCRRRE